MQDDLGAARDALGVVLACRRDLKTAAARGRPDEHLIRTGAAAGDDDAVGDHEGGIEADAELADQPGAVLGLGQPRQKRLGAGARDGAEIVDQFLPVHADAGIDHRQGTGLLVRHDADHGRRAIGNQLRRRDRLVAQLVAGIGGVRDQLAQENLGLRIDRVHHQVQEFGDFGLERLGFGGGGNGLGHIGLTAQTKGMESPDIAMPSGVARFTLPAKGSSPHRSTKARCSWSKIGLNR